MSTPAASPHLRILIVDDIADNRNLLALMLSGEGFEILTAAGGQEALDMVDKHSPNLVLLDVMMPQMDGCEVATAIKSNPRTKTIPVIMITAHDDPQAKRACLAAGAEDFLTKPVDRIDLSMRVRNLLRLNEAIAEADRARVEAERANSAKTEFLRSVTHELRTPLNAIMGYTELLATGVRGSVNVEQARDLARVKRASNYLLQLVEDVLTVARLQGSRPMLPVPIAVNGVMNEVHVLCALQAEEKNITLSVTPSEDVVVTADPDRLQQILLNLVSNTIDFCPTGGTVVMSSEHDATTAQVSIADGGMGVQSREVVGAFEPFMKIDGQAGLASRHGIGLGLSASRELARAMHGDVTLRNTPNVGSIFTLSMPLSLAGS